MIGDFGWDFNKSNKLLNNQLLIRSYYEGSMRGKLKRAGWNDDFLLAMVRAALSHP